MHLRYEHMEHFQLNLRDTQRAETEEIKPSVSRRHELSSVIIIVPEYCSCNIMTICRRQYICFGMHLYMESKRDARLHLILNLIIFGSNTETLK